MSEDSTGADGAQGAPDTQPQGGPPPAQGAALQSQGDADKATDGQDREALLAKIADLERDNLSYRERERQRKAEGSDDLTSRLSDLERQVQEAEQRRADAETRLQEQSLRSSVETEARRLGFRNPADAYALLDMAKVERSSDGQPTNIGVLLTDLAKGREYLLEATDFGGGPRGTSPGSSGPSMNDIIRSAAGRH